MEEVITSPVCTPKEQEGELTVKNITKEEYSQRMDIPRNQPGLMSKSVQKKKFLNTTEDLGKFQLSDTKTEKSSKTAVSREPLKNFLRRKTEPNPLGLEGLVESFEDQKAKLRSREVQFRPKLCLLDE